VARHLRSRGVEEFSPVCTTVEQWSDRKKRTEHHLFPGYIFCRVNPSDRLPVLSIPGAMGLVGFGHGPMVIPEKEIESVRTMVESGLLVQPWPFLEAGQTVLIERGPLSGVEGVLIEVKKGYRLVVSITLLQRSVSAELERDWVRPISPSRPKSRPAGN
jgi:transcription antitermination factor NusG